MSFCGRGERCSERTEDDQPAWTDGQALCVSDTKRVRLSISELEAAYFEIVGSVHSVSSSGSTEPVSGAHDPRKIPVKMAADAYVRDCELIAVSWYESVGAAEGLSNPSGHIPFAAAISRLSVHLGAFLSLPETTVTRWMRTDQIAELDDDVPRRQKGSGDWLVWLDLNGVDGSEELVRLARRGRRLCGSEDDVERISAPCPNELCDLVALVRRPDSGIVKCQACGLIITEAEYEQWAATVLIHAGAV